MEYINILFESFYFKLIIGIFMALILAFADDIKILRNKFMLMLIGLTLLLMISININTDFGIILLLTALFIISYNNMMILRK
jgi:cell division protein FtsW (lipid II flippase)